MFKNKSLAISFLYLFTQSALSSPPCNPPNESNQLKEVASWSAANSPKNWCDGRLMYHLIEGRGQSSHHARPEYAGIRFKDRRWGAVCSDESCNFPSKDMIGYYCGNGVPQKGDRNVAAVKILVDRCGSNARMVWEVQDQPGRWKYPPYADRGSKGRYPSYNGMGSVSGGGNSGNGGGGANGNGGSSGGAMASTRSGSSSGGTVSSGSGSSSGTASLISEAKGVVEELARQHADALRVAYNGRIPDGVTSNERTEFWDRVSQKLHYSLDEGFGYGGRYGDFFCYIPPEYRASGGNPTGNRVEFTSVDFVSGGNPSRLWWSVWPPEKVRQKYPVGHGAHKGRCKVGLRPGAPDYGYGSAGGTGDGSQSTTASTPPTNGVCGTDQPAPHWKTVGGKCLPSCGHAGSLYCKSNDCASLSLSRRCEQGDVALESHEPRPCCLVGNGAADGGGADPSPTSVATDCETLRTQIPELQRRLEEQMKAYRGRRQKKWLGLKRNSCKNVQLCETLANSIHLAASNPSMASRLDHYKKQFGKNCKDFERCRSIAGEIEQIRKDLDASVRAYNKNCRR